jgi:hypothetical protein
VQLSTIQPDGSPLRAHLQAAAAQGRRDPRLSARAPREVAALWDAFVALDASRPIGMAPGPIQPSELLAWQQLHGVRLTQWECDTLLAMDRAAQGARSAGKAKGP